LISHLSLNFLSLESGEDSLKALREILRLYCYSDSAHTHQQINGLRTFEHRKIVRRMGAEAWRGFLRGTEITLTFDESVYVGSSAYLFASVLNYYLALYTSTNSFTQLKIRSLQRQEEWKLWPPMAGAKVVP
jgi:type VI secretion system protein ImpG